MFLDVERNTQFHVNPWAVILEGRGGRDGWAEYCGGCGAVV